MSPWEQFQEFMNLLREGNLEALVTFYADIISLGRLLDLSSQFMLVF